MNVFSKLNKLEQLHKLVKEQKTGSPFELSNVLEISRSSLYILIDELKSFDCQIHYSRKRQTFYYKSEVELTVKWKVTPIEEISELRKFNGGCFTFLIPSRILDGTNLSLHPYSAGYKE